MTIGQLAEAAGVNVETVRYYQRRGLLSTPSKPPGGQRRYSELALERLLFIRNAQTLAFTLGEVERLLATSDGESCEAALEIARQKLAFLEERVGEIARVRQGLRALIKRCDDSQGAAAFAIILSLSDRQPPQPE